MSSDKVEGGQFVRLQYQPEKCGAVIDINESGPEVQYTVFLCGKTRTFFAFQLIPDDIGVNSKKTLPASTLNWGQTLNSVSGVVGGGVAANVSHRRC